MNWSDRLAWSGEVPANDAELHPVALQRFDSWVGDDFADAVEVNRTWHVPGLATGDHDIVADRLGNALRLNSDDPATQQGRLRLDHFEGLWPTSGRLLMGLWVRQSYTMTFNPLMSTRSGTPLAYLSTYTTGSFRHQVYDAVGNLVLDEYEIPAWGGGRTDWMWVGMLVDLDAHTSRMGAVNPDTQQTWVSPVRSTSAAPNPACTASLDVFALPHADYWTGGRLDDVLVAHPTAGFDFPEFLDRLALGTFADAATPAARPDLTVTDTEVTAISPRTLSTGAERQSWSRRPIVSVPDAIPYWSADGGSSWHTGSLPDVFDGLLRWQVPLAAGDTFTGIDLTEPQASLDAIPDQQLLQNSTLDIPLSGQWAPDATWEVSGRGVTGRVTGTTLTLESAWDLGDAVVTVAVTDGTGRAEQSFTVTLVARPWAPPELPQYPRTPIIVWDEHEPAGAIIDALAATVTKQVNGAHTLEFRVAGTHPLAVHLVSERLVEVTGEQYRIRRVTSSRDRRTPVIDVYCEARFYDLAYAGQVDAREWTQTSAGAAMQRALRGTDWTIGAVNVATLRTYKTEDASPLAVLRTIQEQHGGDLVFDNTERSVSLVTQQGRDQGVAFFYGGGLTSSKRVVDTTSLITRLYARNADGMTIAAVNDGVPYLEDHSWTSEVRSAVYDFKSGTSPYTMLAMATATLGNRAKPTFSYEFTVEDLSGKTGRDLDRFDSGDLVTVVDDELGIRVTQRVVELVADIIRPWRSKVTLSGKLRTTSSPSATDAGVLTTGAGMPAFDLVPFNLLLNGRFDNALAHWASSGVRVVDGTGTGDHAVEFTGTGTRWIEQTVQPDNRNVYALSLDVDSSGPQGFVPRLEATALVTYEDGTTETIVIDLE